MKVSPEVAEAAVTIIRLVSTYQSQTGLIPNLLIVGPDVPTPVATSKLLFDMRVMTNDGASKDYEVAYTI